ncbi:MAG: hypothetical protein IT428_04375 [Planctomycetaceae bacterium]|nr:hypothetical protein [Planctomycetaceae bacterium]
MLREARRVRFVDLRNSGRMAIILVLMGTAGAVAPLVMADDLAQEVPSRKLPKSTSSPQPDAPTAKAKANSEPAKPEGPPAAEAAETDEGPAAKVTAGKKWTMLYKWSPQAPLIPRALNEEALVVPLAGFELTGTAQDNVLLGEFKSEGNWATSRAGLQPMEPNSALLLGKAGDFELDGEMSADGLGGWFIGVGLHKGHGYLIYNVTLKTSGSPWLASELRDNRILSATPVEVGRHVWKGYQPFRLLVEKNKLQLVVGKDQVIKDLDLENYHEGDVVLGSYNTKYGPKPLRIRSMRIRAR